jgi:F-type H+-transporting ATPase subunit a
MSGMLLAAGSFNPANEFELNDWVSIHLGPLDMSINKAVAYLAISALVTIALGIFTMRSRLALLPGKRQTVGEAIYELAQNQVSDGLPSKAIGRWFPYVASLFLFIFTMNMLGFIPLPLTGEKWHGIPTWGIYAVTSQLSVTLVLALLSVVFSHIEGVRYNGARHFNFLPSGLPKFSLKTAVPLALMYLLEVVSQVFRVVSLSVRLYANMLAGHMLILLSIGLLFILSGVTFWIVAAVSLPIGIAFYILEVGIVVTIQAFIFALLTGIYIGSAIEPDH